MNVKSKKTGINRPQILAAIRRGDERMRELQNIETEGTDEQLAQWRLDRAMAITTDIGKHRMLAKWWWDNVGYWAAFKRGIARDKFPFS